MRNHARTLTILLIVLLLPLAIYAALRIFGSMDATVHAPTGHFYIVSVVSALAFLMALSVGIAGIRMRNVKVTFIAMAYITLAEIFILHGLATPGLLMHATSLPSATAQMSILISVFWLWLSSMSSDRIIVRLLARRNVLLLPAWTVLLGTVCYILFQNASWFDNWQIFSPIFKISVTIVIAAIAAWTMRRYWQAYLAWGSKLHIMLVYGSGLMIVSQIIMVTGVSWKISWWMYHITLFLSVLFTLIGLTLHYSNRHAFGSSLLQLFRANPREWIETCLSPSVRAIIMATESRDAYTAGHNYRVALYALRLGERLGLNNEQLRAIALGGIVHDVGKLNVPDEILNKPGKLTPQERAIIERHPVSGYDICKRLGFMTEELSVIRSHHERWDGSGYPDRLRQERIPLLARVTAVADVYDALTSSRSYRKAMSHQEALAIIQAERGKHFDPACVDALLQLAVEDEMFFSQTSGSDRQLQLAKS
ncbi:HD-GYP domain-containing protein [Paenibacillus xylaniclasticus]|uniref:HD-GYP domain-containing protein n=1 Tax=Paenibacillus xylaniclasticus TaxID=588083 RepID=UPI000FD9B519|nr:MULTISPECIES: HD-GYP domain-containing protein [Paenibacillus]GFN31552.1 hypothetical protein PCURB6_18120 [Paenibacillus curdlanolyticus]